MTRVPDEAVAALDAVEAVLGRPALGAILSGSAVDGGLRPLSDVDLLVVVEDAPDDVARRRLAVELMRLSGRYGGGGPVRPLDVTLVRHADVVPWRYPPTRAFAYGEWLRAAYEAFAGPAPGPHPDVAIALAQARAIGVALRGPAARDLLDPVPEADLRRALLDALPELLGDLRGDERNVLLTLARMWQTAATGEFVPKDAAAVWAAARLPSGQGAWLELAGRAYVGACADDWQGREAVVAALSERLRAEIERACSLASSRRNRAVRPRKA
jgi:aminoglycoside 9-adenylyltransferase